MCSQSLPIYTIAGHDVPGSADVLSSYARFDGAYGVAVDGAGNVYVADTGNGTIRKISPDGRVSTFAGSPASFGSVNGTGTNALFFAPQGITVDAAGSVRVFAGAPPTGPVANAGPPIRGKPCDSLRPKNPSFEVAAPLLGVRCVWSWGDGTSPTEIFQCDAENLDQEVRVYSSPGTYRVVLRVEDGFGLFGESGTLAVIE